MEADRQGRFLVAMLNIDEDVATLKQSCMQIEDELETVTEPGHP